MKRMAQLFLMGLFLFGFSEAALALSLSYEQTFSAEGREVKSRVSLKDNYFRIESDAGGNQSIVISNEQGMFSIMPTENVAMKLPSDPTISQELRKNAENYLTFLEEQGAEKVDSETLGEYACDVYEFTQPGASGATRVWVWTQHNFPVQVIADGTKIRMRDVDFGVTLPKSLFELPEGLEVIDLQGVDLNQ